MTKIISDYRQVTSEFITEQFLRDDGFKKISISAPAYMSEGPGRYAKISDVPIVVELFENGLNIPNGTYTVAYLKELYESKGNEPFITGITHLFTDPLSADYGERAYVWNSTSFIVLHQVLNPRLSAGEDFSH